VSTARPVCVLVGPPGSGKTSVGQLLARQLAVEFRDTDADIEAIAGKPIPEIFLDDGEDHFRTLERQSVAAALASFDGVLALGGGAVLAEGTREALAGHTVVFLSVDLPDAIKRVGLGQGRPLLAVNPRATLKHQLELRRPLYESVATVTVPTDGRGAAEVADEIAGWLRQGRQTSVTSE
jgi:shikimate kinase